MSCFCGSQDSVLPDYNEPPPPTVAIMDDFLKNEADKENVLFTPFKEEIEERTNSIAPPTSKILRNNNVTNDGASTKDELPTAERTNLPGSPSPTKETTAMASPTPDATPVAAGLPQATSPPSSNGPESPLPVTPSAAPTSLAALTSAVQSPQSVTPQTPPALGDALPDFTSVGGSMSPSHAAQTSTYPAPTAVTASDFAEKANERKKEADRIERAKKAATAAVRGAALQAQRELEEIGAALQVQRELEEMSELSRLQREVEELERERQRAAEEEAELDRLTAEAEALKVEEEARRIIAEHDEKIRRIAIETKKHEEAVKEAAKKREREARRAQAEREEEIRRIAIEQEKHEKAVKEAEAEKKREEAAKKREEEALAPLRQELENMKMKVAKIEERRSLENELAQMKLKMAEDAAADEERERLATQVAETKRKIAEEEVSRKIAEDEAIKRKIVEEATTAAVLVASKESFEIRQLKLELAASKESFEIRQLKEELQNLKSVSNRNLGVVSTQSGHERSTADFHMTGMGSGNRMDNMQAMIQEKRERLRIEAAEATAAAVLVASKSKESIENRQLKEELQNLKSMSNMNLGSGSNLSGYEGITGVSRMTGLGSRNRMEGIQAMIQEQSLKSMSNRNLGSASNLSGYEGSTAVSDMTGMGGRNRMDGTQAMIQEESLKSLSNRNLGSASNQAGFEGSTVVSDMTGMGGRNRMDGIHALIQEKREQLRVEAAKVATIVEGGFGSGDPRRNNFLQRIEAQHNSFSKPSMNSMNSMKSMQGSGREPCANENYQRSEFYESPLKGLAPASDRLNELGSNYSGGGQQDWSRSDNFPPGNSYSQGYPGNGAAGVSPAIPNVIYSETNSQGGKFNMRNRGGLDDPSANTDFALEEIFVRLEAAKMKLQNCRSDDIATQIETVELIERLAAAAISLQKLQPN